jgi:peptide/nickel transport system ATP-binding protein
MDADRHLPSMSPGLILSVRDLKTYFMQDEGTVRAVDGASFDVSAGRTLGIVGESGCGKSITARSILRLIDHPGRIVGGQILFRRPARDGAAGPGPTIDLAQLEPSGKAIRQIRGGEIALVFQEPMSSFSPVHTIGDQIAEIIEVHLRIGRHQATGKALEMLRRVGIPTPEQRLNEYPHQLSGGLRQRVMIAMALACNPSLLIADEPTTALDVTTQAQILDLLRDLQQQYRMAIMLITHDLGVIAQMADEVVVMYLGNVVEQAPVDAIFHAPKHPYTQALLRSIPRIRSRSRQRLTSISGFVPHPYNRPTGCPFHPRCSAFMPGTCDRALPGVRSVGAEHRASCFLYPEDGA